jgi:hypothetical protein
MITDANTTLTDNRAANPGLTAGLTLENLSFEPRYTAAFGPLGVIPPIPEEVLIFGANEEQLSLESPM